MMQYGTDGFEFRRRGLLRSRNCLDFTQETSVAQLIISGTEPEGTARRVIFEIEGELYKFTNGALDKYDERGELADILAAGNTVAELMALENIAGFVGKRVFPIIALEAAADAEVMPRIKLSAKVNSYNDVYSKVELSPEYELNGRIVRVSSAVSTNGFGAVSVKCRLKSVTGWSDWQNVEEVKGKQAQAIQFQASYVVTTLDGTDNARLESVAAEYVTGDNAADYYELVTAAEEFDANLGTCYVLVKHDELEDCAVTAYVKYSAPLQHREVMLGNATGREQTFKLPDRMIDVSSLRVEIGGRALQGFEYDTRDSSIKFSGTAGLAITASYDFGGEEVWREMALEGGKYVYRLSESIDSRVSAVKVRFEKKTGHIEENLGAGTGREQIFATEHRATNLTCTGAHRYDERTRILRVLAPIGESIRVAYDWRGEFPAVKEVICGWQARNWKGDGGVGV